MQPWPSRPWEAPPTPALASSAAWPTPSCPLLPAHLGQPAAAPPLPQTKPWSEEEEEALRDYVAEVGWQQAAGWGWRVGGISSKGVVGGCRVLQCGMTPDASVLAVLTCMPASRP